MTWGLHSFCISSVGGPVPIDVSNWGCAFSIWTHVASEGVGSSSWHGGRPCWGSKNLDDSDREFTVHE